MKTYTFQVVVERDEDRWHAYCPALEQHGAATWGYTHEAALASIEEVVKLVVESLIEHGDPVPISPSPPTYVPEAPEVAVTV